MTHQHKKGYLEPFKVNTVGMRILQQFLQADKLRIDLHKEQTSEYLIYELISVV